ncbi:hypothetical protein B0H63DRAFT_507582 [Podospora didyma]|uniref:Uncharacterized protein n=1 Tax=Podospora didyma TaxID=330526 RepID=A0AAE0NYN9_9PEZI|nr:hypothetical protein B0H63DRAFT_507582 [Podospora didyma]
MDIYRALHQDYHNLKTESSQRQNPVNITENSIMFGCGDTWRGKGSLYGSTETQGNQTEAGSSTSSRRQSQWPSTSWLRDEKQEEELENGQRTEEERQAEIRAHNRRLFKTRPAFGNFLAQTPDDRRRICLGDSNSKDDDDYEKEGVGAGGEGVEAQPPAAVIAAEYLQTQQQTLLQMEADAQAREKKNDEVRERMFRMRVARQRALRNMVGQQQMMRSTVLRDAAAAVAAASEMEEKKKGVR